jgi:hypothetical protein
MTDDAQSAARRQRNGLIVLVALGLVAGGVSFQGTRASWQAAVLRNAANAAGADGTIDVMALPMGPHQTEFQAACVICHSARLPLTQPYLNRDKWTEIVHKMVTAYGAPATPQEEAQIVDYLLAIQEPRS